MGKDVRVFAYDDITHAQTGRKDEASHLNVRLVLGDREVLIDLDDQHYGELAGFLRPYLKAGHPPDKVNTGTRKTGRHPRAYYEALRKFAADRGIEIAADGTGKHIYPAGLRRDFEASLTWNTSRE